MSLTRCYHMIEQQMAGGGWAMGEAFGLCRLRRVAGAVPRK